MIGSSLPPELPVLMRRARWRVLHIWFAVFAIMAVTTAQISGSGAKAAPIIAWCVGCAIILGLGLIWYRVRARATHRLLEVLGTKAIQRVCATRIRLYFIPIGYEVDVDLRGEEHLAFGFWSRRDFESLQAILGVPS